MTKKQKVILWAGFVLYILILVWIILFHGTLETMNSAFDPDFRAVSFYLYFNGRESLLNMLIFVPFGVYVAALFDKNALCKKVWLIVAATLTFEILQYIFAVGTTDIMDIINNTVGGCIGIAAGSFVMRILRDRFYKVAVPVAAAATTGMAVFVLLFPLR